MDQPFVTGQIDTPAGPVPVVPASLTRSDRWGAIRVRWGVGRYTYTVDPGLYAIGAPDDGSPVLVTANYKLSFDALRRELAGRDVWVLVLDTRGINVWCAAGRGTFGTDELVQRIAGSGLARVVSHGTVILPQLGAPGVASPEVRRRSGFHVAWGPVRASDVPAFIDGGLKATAAMRRVTFQLRERAVLIPVEAVGMLGVAATIAAAAVIGGGVGPGWFSLDRLLLRAPFAVGGVLSAFSGGAVVTPLLLPWLPGRMFSVKGAIAGLAAVGVWLAGVSIAAPSASSPWPSLAAAALLATAGASFLAMNFTGSSTFTSLHGVEKEMSAAMPWQIAGAAFAALLWILGGWV